MPTPSGSNATRHVGGTSPPPTPQRGTGSRHTPDRPGSHDRPSAPVNTLSPTVGAGGVSVAGRTQQSPNSSTRVNTNTAGPGVSPRPESRPVPDYDHSNMVDDADLPIDIDEFDLMLSNETANHSFHDGPNTNSLVAEFQNRLIRDKLARSDLSGPTGPHRNETEGRSGVSKIHVPVAQKPVPTISRENGLRQGAGNPMGFESPNGGNVFSQSGTPMPRPGSRAPSDCHFCGCSGCTGNCPRAREVSPVMVGALPGNKSVTPSGLHVTQSPLMYSSNQLQPVGLRLGSPMQMQPPRSASGGEGPVELTSPAAGGTPVVGTTPRGANTPHRARGSQQRLHHIDPMNSQPLAEATAPVPTTTSSRRHSRAPADPPLVRPTAVQSNYGQKSALRHYEAPAANATLGSPQGNATTSSRPAQFSSNASTSRRARIAHPVPARPSSDDGSNTSSVLSTRTQPQRWEEELKKRSKPTKRRILRSTGSAWSEGRTESCASGPSVSLSTPTKAPPTPSQGMKSSLVGAPK